MTLINIATIKQKQSIIGVSLLTKLVKDHGVALEPLLKAASISPDLLDDAKAKITLKQDFDFVTAMLKAIDQPLIGFYAGQCFRLSAFGNVGMAAALSEKVEDAIELFLKYIGLLYTPFDISFFKNEGIATLRFSDQYELGALRRFYIERDFSFALVSSRDMFPRTLADRTFRSLHFDFDCPTSVVEYEKLYQCKVKFSMPYNEVVFDERYLYQTLPLANPLTRQLLEEQCDTQVIEILGPSGYAEKIREIIRTNDGTIPNLEDISEQFYTTSRTVRRKLKEEGYTFQALLKDELARKAIHLLQTTKLSIEQIADRLGYGESSSFIHAFKRWTGKVPKNYRG